MKDISRSFDSIGISSGYGHLLKIYENMQPNAGLKKKTEGLRIDTNSYTSHNCFQCSMHSCKPFYVSIMVLDRDQTLPNKQYILQQNLTDTFYDPNDTMSKLMSIVDFCNWMPFLYFSMHHRFVLHICFLSVSTVRVSTSFAN